MRSPEPRLTLRLLRLELRQLVVGRAFWAMLLIAGPLAGYSFLQAVVLFADVSRSAARLPAVTSNLSPLDGVVIPTFSALYLVNTFLLPFVAIRLISADKQTSSLKLLLQLPIGPARAVAIKLAAVCLGWTVVLVPGASALAIWLGLGGHLYAPEVLGVLVGHALYGLVIIGAAFLAATLAESSATAAILVLAFSIGAWVLEFAGANQVGLVRAAAGFSLTPTLRSVERGLLGTPQIGSLVIPAVALLALSGVWLPSGTSRMRKVTSSAVVLAVALVAGLLVFRQPAYADLSEDHRNSFNPADERALRQLDQQLDVTVYLAPNDSRLRDLERNVLSKLRRVVPRLSIEYADTGASGLFGGRTGSQYGKVVYGYAGQHIESPATSAVEVLPVIHLLATGSPVIPERTDAYRGYPLVADASGLAWWFYAALPGLACVGWWLSRRPPGRKGRVKSMSRIRRAVASLIGASLVLAILPGSVAAQPAAPLQADFTRDEPGTSPSSFTTPVGFWSIGADGLGDGSPFLVEDGSRWAGPERANALADQARALYGERWAEFIDDLPENSYFPIAVFKPVENFSQGTVTMRFKVVGGNVDHDVGILFNYRSNGDYMALRSDTEENNLLLYRWIEGQPASLTRVRNVPTAFLEWHEQQLVVSGSTVSGYVDGKKYLEQDLGAPVSGRVGLWAKTDTVVIFDRFRVEPAE